MKLVDDFKLLTAAGFPSNKWKFVADSVMGGGSKGRLARIDNPEAPALRMTGEVNAKDGSGFILVSLDLNGETKVLDASEFAGVRLALKGNGEEYAVHLRTKSCLLPWQFYSAPVKTTGVWQVVTVPFKSFERRSIEAPLDPSKLKEIAIAATDRSFAVDLSVSHVAFVAKTTFDYKPLDADEKAVILDRATERAFTGDFDKNKEAGAYTCKRCGAALYRSTDKFDSGCGWPSFDAAVEGAVLRLPDADGYRVEIVCADCGGHLGHVFSGEGFTAKNTRHCVNSISLEFTKGGVAASEAPPTERAIFASGCFWGTEYFLQQAPGVISTTVGYIGGRKEQPTYEEVCAGLTGHAEAVVVVYDPAKTTYEALARLYFETHDFTQVNRQGPDIGKQYRTEVFYLTDEQRKVAEGLIEKLSAQGHKVATKVTKATRFWPAEDYHQDYYKNNGETPYCHIKRDVFE